MLYEGQDAVQFKLLIIAVTAVPFLLILAVLLIRPNGLFGEART